MVLAICGPSRRLRKTTLATLGRLVCVLVYGALPACSSAHRFIYNSDGDNMFIHTQPPMRVEQVQAYVDEVADTQVTTLFVCPQVGMATNYPSQVGDMLGTNVTPAEAQQITKHASAPHASRERAAANLLELVHGGQDPLQLILDRAQEKGLEVFLTFRLNEVHAVDRPDEFPQSLLISSFWREHPEWHIGTPGDKVAPVYLQILGPRASQALLSWLPGALNFAVPEVRKHRLVQLREVCERYAVDGLDLDFLRFPMYFPPGTEKQNIETMTAWMREVREMARQVGEARDRPLLVSARILARPELNLAIGLDPSAWVKEGLVDFVTVSHYLHNNFPLPVAEYREVLPGIPIYGSIELEDSVDRYRAVARDLWAQGTDGIMLFNFFIPRENGKQPPFELLQELGEP